MACAELQKPNQDSIDEECWQSSLGSPGDRLSAMLNLSRLTDLTITFPDYEESLKVHRLILAMSSPVFEVMLFGPMAEGGKLVLPEDPPEAFIWLMSYIYCGSKNLPDVPTAVQVYLLSNKYQMKALSSICSKFLLSKLTADNLPLIYDAASLLEDSALQEKCRQVVSVSLHKVLSSSYIGQLGRQSMKYLLQHNAGVQSEVTVYKGLIRWGEFRAGKALLESEGLSVREEVEELLPLVRFLTMTVDEFIKHVMPSQVLTSYESSAILMNIKQVGAMPVPGICSQMRERRIFYDMANCYQVTLNNSFNLYNSDALYERQKEYQYRKAYKGGWLVVPGKASRHTFRRYNGDRFLVLVRDMKVNKDIHLGGIKYTAYLQKTYLENITVVITNSTGTVLREVKPEFSKDRMDSYRIFATFLDPLVLISKETYSVWLRGNEVCDHGETFSVEYRDLSITGTLGYDGNLVIKFWCFDNTFR